MATILALGLSVLARERVSRVSLAFFLMTLTVGIWLFAQSLVYSSAGPDIALRWARAGYLGVPFIAPATYLFTVVVLRIYRQYRVVVWAGWILAVLFSAAALWTDALFDGVKEYSWGYYAKYNWLGAPFILFFFSMLAASMWHYWTEYKV